MTIEEVRDHLTELIHRLIPDAEVVITENNQPVARLVPAALPSEARKVPRLGMLKAGLPRFLTSLWDEPDNKRRLDFDSVEPVKLRQQRH